MATKRKGPEPLDADREHRCEIFNCDYRRGSYCCAYCWRKDVCRNPCQNGPERCGQCYTEGKTGGETRGKMDDGGTGKHR